jgi:hypothetical protein
MGCRPTKPSNADAASNKSTANKKNGKNNTITPDLVAKKPNPAEEAAQQQNQKKAKGKNKKDEQGNEVQEDQMQPGLQEKNAGNNKKSGNNQFAHLNLSELADLPVYGSENPNFGELSPIMSPKSQEARAKAKKEEEMRRAQQKSNKKLNQSQAGDQSANQNNPNGNQSINQQPIPKKIVVRRQKTTPFGWPNQGSVEIKTINFKIKFNHVMKGFKTLKSKDNYQTTMLSWKKNEDEDVFEFTMKDIMLTTLRTGVDTPLNGPEINFMYKIINCLTL